MLSASLNKTFPSFELQILPIVCGMVHIKEILLLIRRRANRQTRGPWLSCLLVFVYIHIAIEFPLGCHATATRVRPFSGLSGQPRETTQHVPGPSWATFGLLIQKHYVQIAPKFLPTGHSKFHNTLNTLRLLPTLIGLLVLPCIRQCRRRSHPLLFFSLSRTEEPAKDGTCARDWRACYNSLLWMCTLNTLIVTVNRKE